MKLSCFPKACFIAFLYMCKPRVIRFIFYYTLSVLISIALGKSFPFHFKMHDITPHIGLNLNSALKANVGCVYLR